MSTAREPVAAPTARIRLLGPVTLTGPAGPVPLAGAKAKAILAVLALNVGRLVTVDDLIDRVWGPSPPVTVRNAVQVYVAGLRRALREVATPSGLQTVAGGYRLDDGHVAIDADEFNRYRAAGLGAQRAGASDDALRAFRAALDCWHGPALADLADLDGLQSARLLLETSERLTFASVAELELAAGNAASVLPELVRRSEGSPQHEALAGLVGWAQYQLGDQAAALATLRAVRRDLRLAGLEPDEKLRDLEVAILRHDPALRPARLPDQPPAAPAMRTLTVVAAPDLRVPRLRTGDGPWIELSRPRTLLGRDPHCDVVVADPRVSSRHALVSRDGDTDVIEDLGSRNGTWVNGSMVSRARLATGDHIVLGQSQVHYESGAPPVGGVDGTVVGESAT